MFRSGRPFVVLVLLASACGSPLFAYDPTGASETPTCLADADCVAGHCEVATGRCFLCNADAHCGDDAKVCRDHACVLAAGRCDADADCGGAAGKPRCDASRRCAECVDASDCGGAECRDGACALPPGCHPVGPGDLPRVEVRSLKVLATEAGSQAYASCVAAACCEARSADAACTADADDRPVNCVSLLDAERFCRWVGGRVPSGGEWSSIAGGEANGRFPWGLNPAPSCAVAVMSDLSGRPCGGAAPAKACSVPAGNTVDGLCDVGGNLWEWTQESAGPRRVLRGGSFASQNPETLRNGFRSYSEDPARRLADAGIRCVW